METKDLLLLGGAGLGILYLSGKIKLGGQSLAASAGSGLVGGVSEFGGGVFGSLWDLGFNAGQGMRDAFGWNNTPVPNTSNNNLSGWNPPYKNDWAFITDKSEFLQMSDYKRIAESPGRYPSSEAQYKKEVASAIQRGTSERNKAAEGVRTAAIQKSNPYVEGTANWYLVEARGHDAQNNNPPSSGTTSTGTSATSTGRTQPRTSTAPSGKNWNNVTVGEIRAAGYENLSAYKAASG